MLPSPLMYPRFVLELCGIAVASLQTFPISKYTKELICSSVPCDQCVYYYGYTHRSDCFSNTNPANTLYFPCLTMSEYKLS